MNPNRRTWKNHKSMETSLRVRCPEGLSSEFRAYAEEKGLGRSEALRQLLRYALDSLTPSEEGNTDAE